MSEQYKLLTQKGLCRCSACKPTRYRAGGICLLSTALPETEYEIVYVIYRDHIERQIDNLKLTI